MSVEAKCAEPVIIAQNREQLAYLLTEAAEIEHGLMCCYLFAAYSLKSGISSGLSATEIAAVARWRGAIVEVAIEEMLHLSLVSNLLTAIGFSPQFERPNFPVAAGYHPSGIVVSLAPFDLATLDHFIFLERPEGMDLRDGIGFDPPPMCERATRSDRLMPSAEDYETVGHLYRGIRAGFETLATQLGEEVLFLGDPTAQLGPEVAALSGLTVVTNVASAWRAIDTIVEQGEGTQTDSVRSHYRRFIEVRAEYQAMLTARPDFLPAFPVARNPVMRKPPDSRGKVHIEDPRAARVLDLGNALYHHVLRVLSRAFGRSEDPPAARRALVETAVEAMRLLSPVAQLLCQLPAGDKHPGVNAGLTFAMARSNAGDQQGAIWPLLVERTRELAASFAMAATEVDSALGVTAGHLTEMADRLERVSPVAPNRSRALGVTPMNAIGGLDTAVGAAPANARPTVPTLEEARGRNLLLRFEAKRCIHSRHCVLDAPEVFQANVEGPWLHPDRVTAESLSAVARSCPSGAITYERLDGGPAEVAPPVNTLSIRENGPLAVHADIEIEGLSGMFRATLCRCGASQNKPFCDNSHIGLMFVASGEPPTQPSTALEIRGGPLTISPAVNGPLSMRGNLEICSGTGRTVTRLQQTTLCRCGGSGNKPFCDGTHARIGFRSE